MQSNAAAVLCAVWLYGVVYRLSGFRPTGELHASLIDSNHEWLLAIRMLILWRCLKGGGTDGEHGYCDKVNSRVRQGGRKEKSGGRRERHVVGCKGYSGSECMESDTVYEVLCVCGGL